MKLNSVLLKDSYWCCVEMAPATTVPTITTSATTAVTATTTKQTDGTYAKY